MAWEMGPPSVPDEADFMVRDSTFLMLSFPPRSEVLTPATAHAAAAVLS